MSTSNFDGVLLYVQHVPCSLNCGKSLEISLKNRAVLEANDSNAAYYWRDYNTNLVYEFYYRYPLDNKSW